MKELKIGDRVKVSRKSEFGGQWQEVGRGLILALAQNRIGETVFAKYLDADWPQSFDFGEWICISAPSVKIIQF